MEGTEEAVILYTVPSAKVPANWKEAEPDATETVTFGDVPLERISPSEVSPDTVPLTVNPDLDIFKIRKSRSALGRSSAVFLLMDILQN